MIENFELRGRWRLPNNKDWLNGTLYFNPEERTRLELFGSFNTTFNTAKIDVILGETNKGDVSLIDNMFGGRTSHQNGVIIGKYNPKLVFKGHHFNTEDDLKFSKIKFQVFNLFQWFNLTGINTDWGKKGNDIAISYSEIEEIKFKVNESCEGIISFLSPISAEGAYNRIEMEERCIVTFQYADSKPYNDILIDMSHFISFITLCTFEQSYPMSIQFQDEQYKEDFNGKEINKTIRLAYEHIRYDSKHRIRRKHEHLIAYQDIKNDFSKVIENWHPYHEKLDTVFNLMLSIFKQKTKFSEYDFLDIIRSIESYHKQIYNKKKMPDSEHESKVKRILGSCKLADLDLKWLQRKLTKQYDPNLRERVKFLVHEYTNSYIESKFKEEQIYDAIINSRNYYAHYDKDMEYKELKGIPLFNLTQKLMGLIYSCIVTDVGVDKAIFENSLNDLLWE